MTLPYSFSAGEIAKSLEVNENFVFLKDRITTTASALQTSINSVQNSVSSVTTRVNGHDTSISNINSTISGLSGNYSNISLTNTNGTGKANVAKWGMPKYSSRASRSWNTEYTETSNGYILVRGCLKNDVSGGKNWTLTINGQNYVFETDDGDWYWTRFWYQFAIPSGVAWKASGGWDSSRKIYFIPCLGG